MTAMQKAELANLYDRDPDFKGYVDRCRRVNGRTVEQMLTLHTISDYAGWLKNIKKGEQESWMD